MISVKGAERILKRCKGRKVLVVGDLMLDRYIFGSVDRISPEAPVPVVKVSRETSRPGGAANVALNVQSLGGQAVVAGLAGQDEAGEELMATLKSAGIQTAGVLAHKKRATTVKTRVLAERQQVVRVDREDAPELSAEVVAKFCKILSGLPGGVDGVVIEDYGKGVICQPVVDAVLKAAHAAKVPVGFDPKDNHELSLNGLRIATPNYVEALGAAGLRWTPLATRDLETDKTLRMAGDRLLAKWTPDFLVITLGAQGMYLLKPGGEPVIIPTRAREVFDVSGAGDTVIASAVLALAAGASSEEAAALANYAAGVVVGKIGTATCSPSELLASIY